MTTSALIVFLPLVGAILGAIVGAFGGAYANNWYRDREAKKVQDEERKGLLFLISSEVWFNHLLLDATSLGPPSGPISNLQTDVWDGTQTRLAQLIPADFMYDLVTYYGQIRIKQISSLTGEEEMPKTARTYIEQTQALGAKIIREAQTYIEDFAFADPAQLDLVEDFRKRFGE